MNPGEYDEEIKNLGCKIYYNRQLTIANSRTYIAYFCNFLKKHAEYKIVHAYQDAWCSVFCKGAYLAGVPVRIAHSRTAISSVTVKNICKNIIKLPCRKYATHYFAVSDKAGKWLFGEKLYRQGKVELWKNAIDAQQFRFNERVRKEVRKELNLSGRQLALIHVGNFTSPKNHSFLIDVFQELVKVLPESVLILVGGDTLVEKNMAAVREKVQEKGLTDKVLFLGNRNDVNRLLQAGDVFVFPSIFEGFPGAVLEAQAAGLPCIISSSITEEVKLLDTTRMLSLKAPLKSWVSAICRAKKEKRRDTYEEITAQGFDIHELVKELMIFYENEEKKIEAV